MRVFRKDYLGTLVSLLVFLAGIAMLMFVFKTALDLFSIPPENAVGIKKTEPFTAETAGRSGMQLVWRIVLMLIMSIIASIIANRGIRLYSEAKHGEAKHAEASKPTKDE